MTSLCEVTVVTTKNKCVQTWLWITRDLMVHCTLWTDPQVFTGGSFGWSQDKRQGTGVAGDLLDGSEQWLPPGEKDCCSFLPHLPPHPEAACSSRLPCSGPTSLLILLLSSQLSQSRKLACRSFICRCLWAVRVAVWWYNWSLGFSEW